MVGVGVSLEDPGDGVFLLGDEIEEGVGGGSGDGAGRWIVVEDWIDDGNLQGAWVGDNVLPRSGDGLKYALNDWLFCLSGAVAPACQLLGEVEASGLQNPRPMAGRLGKPPLRDVVSCDGVNCCLRIPQPLSADITARTATHCQRSAPWS